MAETSRFWDGTAIGDAAAAPYDGPTETAAVLRSLAGAGAIPVNQGGVFTGELNELAVSGGGSPVTVASGRALAYGSWYESSAGVTVAIPTPASATRIDRIVLRKDWTLQTVRITRIAGVEGGSAPALVQTLGVTWDTPLAQASITTIGVITLTDERDFLGPHASGWYGDGADGDVVISGNTTLTRDMCYRNLTVNPAVILATGGFKVFVLNVATINGVLSNDGPPGVTVVGGVGVTGTLLGGSSGGNTATDGANFAANTAGWGGLGGAGGSGVAGGVGTGTWVAGTLGTPTASPHQRTTAIQGGTLAGTTVKAIGGGSGGGGGTHGSVDGGGAGAGGGFLLLAARFIIVGATGVIRAEGGAGVDGLTAGGAGNCGGGGGGGGGLIVLIYDTLTNSGSIEAHGGLGGAANGTGGAGAAGSVGTIVLLGS